MARSDTSIRDLRGAVRQWSLELSAATVAGSYRAGSYMRVQIKFEAPCAVFESGLDGITPLFGRLSGAEVCVRASDRKTTEASRYSLPFYVWHSDLQPFREMESSHGGLRNCSERRPQ